MQFTERIETSLKDMRPGEADVARHLLRDPSRVATNSLRDVAAWCGTSDTTVLRAVRAAGFDGYQDLKYHVLRELTTRESVQKSEQPTTQIPTEDMQASLTACRSTLKKAAAMLRRSKRIAIVGSGDSGGVGQILGDVLCAFGRHAVSLLDDQAVDFALAPSSKGLVLVAISHSGETSFPVRAVRKAKQAQIPTIGLTNEPASELGQLVDVLLPTQSVERPEGSFSIVPRLCQLAILNQLIEELKSENQSNDGKQRRRIRPKVTV
ncbi:MAG: MurR/RpiR family transcriptional regulator [Fuerstiella sp.]|nr:MurR/RpiR family transcriptional regulator [Fuerstiella sp.]